MEERKEFNMLIIKRAKSVMDVVTKGSNAQTSYLRGSGKKKWAAKLVFIGKPKCVICEGSWY